MKKAINKNGFRFKPYLPHQHKKLGFGQIPIEKPELDFAYRLKIICITKISIGLNTLRLLKYNKYPKEARLSIFLIRNKKINTVKRSKSILIT